MLGDSDTNKDVKEISSQLKELENKRKIVELDLEKRILELEGSIGSINKTLHIIKDLEKTEKGLETIQDIRDKLREMEDLELINKLETIESKDLVNELKNIVSNNEEKVKLLTNAVKIMGEKGFAKEGVKTTTESLSDLSNSIKVLQKKVGYLEGKEVSEEETKKLQDSVKIVRDEMDFMNKQFRDFIGNVKDELGLYERKFNDEMKNGNDFSDYIKEIKNIKNELFVLKEVNKKLEDIVEKGRSNSEMMDDKTREDVKKLYTLYSSLSEMDKKYKKAEIMQKDMENQFKEIAKLLKQKKLGKDFIDKSQEVYNINQKIEKLNLEVGKLKKVETDSNFLRNEIVSLKKIEYGLKEKINKIESKGEMVVSKILKDERINEGIKNKLDRIVEERVSLLHQENEILRRELEQLKKAYFNIIQQREKAPVILE